MIEGRVDEETLRRRAIQWGAREPIWLVGSSLARTNVKSPRMFPEVIFAALESMQDEFGVKPTLLLFDYIQLIPVRGQSRRFEQVMNAAHLVKELLTRVGCPGAVAGQAGRQVDERAWKVPGPADGQFSSSIEQTTDKGFGIWRPWLTEDHFDEDGNQATLRLDGIDYPITRELLIMQMWKQRFGPSPHTWALHLDPRYLRLCELETDVEEALQNAR